MVVGVKRCAQITAMGGLVLSALCFVLTQSAFGLTESTDAGGSNAIAVHQLGEIGQGINIGFIAASNARTTHEAFKDGNGVTHVFNYDFGGDGISITAHDTQLAGIIVSRGGSAYPNDLGVAPGADLYCARVSNNSSAISTTWITNALNELINNQHCRVIVTGFELQGSTDANGDNPWTLLYDYYACQYGVIFANPAGNDNTYVAIFGDAYNGITTGGLKLTDLNNPSDYREVGTASGSGPTTDGRRKPDITAPSQNQWVPTSNSDTAWSTTYNPTGGETSWSVPHAAGVAALLLGLADQTLGSDDNSNVVIKAVIVNSTMPNVEDKTGAETNPADSNNTWNEDRGYGRIDALRAYQLLNTNEVVPGITITQNKGWGYAQLLRNRSNTYTIHIPQICRLIATTTWNRRVTYPSLAGYLANIDMSVFAPGAISPFFNKTIAGYDASDNLIKCDTLILSPGDYTINIANNSSTNETANYGFAFELHPIIAGDLPTPDYVVDFIDFATLAKDWRSSTSSLDALLSPNGKIDLLDLAVLAGNWLQIDPLYYQY